MALSSIDTRDWSLADFKDDCSDQWKIGNLHMAIEAEDVKRILQVVPGGEGSRNGFSWVHTNTGEYSVKLGYKLWISRFRDECLAPEQQPSFSQIYKEIWSTDTSSKLKHFVWRSSRSALSVGVEMKKKRLTREALCQICGTEQEDVQHLIFQCPMAKAIWSLSPFAAILRDISCSFMGQLYTCMQLQGSVPEEYKNLWSWLMWRIWKMRNELVFQNITPDVMKGYNMALSDHNEWRQNAKPTEQTRSLATPTIGEVLTWIPPQLGALKCNTDASWHKDKERCGIGWILRDKGHLKFWGVKTYPKLRSPLEAEASSLIWAAKCMWNMGYINVIFESDSSSVVDAVQDPKRWPRLLTHSTEFQDKILRTSRNFQVQKVSRERNKAADRLASYEMAQEI